MLNCGWLLAGGSLIGVKVVVHSHLVHWWCIANYQEIAVKWKEVSAWLQIGGCLKGFLYALLGMRERELVCNGVYGESRMIRNYHW